MPPEERGVSDDNKVVQASVEGLGSATVSIPVTTDITTHICMLFLQFH